jgi:hypothetical protein
MRSFVSGAKSSAERERYDLCELVALQRWARRMAKGVASHGERNYQKGARDPAFIRDRINHLIEHALKYASGDRSDDHLGAVMANASMLIWLEDASSQHETIRKSFDEAREAPEPCHCGRLVTRPDQCPGLPCPMPKTVERDLAGVVMGPDV